jgi:hypothetical protein
MKILLLSLARTGSNYFYHEILKHIDSFDLLLSEPFKYEIMTTVGDEYTKSILEKISKAEKILFKTHLNQLDRISNADKLTLLNQNWHKIILLRKNIFKCTISHALADVFDQFSEYTYDETLKLSIDRKIFEELFLRKLKHWEQFVEFKAQNKIDDILYYEDFTFVPRNDFNKISLSEKYNNILATKLNTERKAPNNSKIINNYDELQDIANNILASYNFKGIYNNNGLLELI